MALVSLHLPVDIAGSSAAEVGSEQRLLSGSSVLKFGTPVSSRSWLPAQGLQPSVVIPAKPLCHWHIPMTQPTIGRSSCSPERRLAKKYRQINFTV